MTRETVIACLSGNYPWADRLHFFPSIDSTNRRLKVMAKEGAPQGTVLLATHQTDGLGRLGRSFHSPEGKGIYMSMLLRPCCVPTELMHLTCACAVAMCDAVESCAGFRPGIKWTNDLVFGQRKLGGILTELGLTPDGKADYAIIGIGINCMQQPEEFPEEIRQIAGSLSWASQNEVSMSQVAAAMMEALWKMDGLLLSEKKTVMENYCRDCITLGTDISLLRGDTVRHGHACGLDDNGGLLVEFSDGHIETVTSGEVSIRGMYGYL